MKLMAALLLTATIAQAETFEQWLATQADQDLPRATARWKDHITQRNTNGCPDGFVLTGYTYEQVAEDLIVETAVCAPVVAWTNTAEYAARVKAAAVVSSIKTTLQAIGVTPVSREQVFTDVRSWAYSNATVQAALTALDLRNLYDTLAALVPDTTGLIAGTRDVSLAEGTDFVVDAED